MSKNVYQQYSLLILFLFWRLALTSAEKPLSDFQMKRIFEGNGETKKHPCDDLPGNYSSWRSTAQTVGILIVGGGPAGLTIVKDLLENNISNILLLEADDYLGGRIKTYRKGNILVEVGAEFIHGGELNPLYQLASKLKEVVPSLPDTAYDKRVVTRNGKKSDPSHENVLELQDECSSEDIIQQYPNASYGQCFLDRFPKAYGKGSKTNLGKAWLHLLEQIVLYLEGTDSWLANSARDSIQYAHYGENYQWKNGYDTLINYLKAGIPDTYVRLSTPVCRIIWDGINENKALVVSKGGQSTYLADHVIVTSSVGHIRDRHMELFQPSLPASFLKNLSGISLGVADKIQIGWSKPWWGKKPLFALILWTKFDFPDDMNWLYGIVLVVSVHQQKSTLQIFVTGHHAWTMENLPQRTVKKHLRKLLSKVTRMKVPRPTFFRRSQWGRNPWTRGSYSSFVTVEGEKNGILNREPFKIPLKNAKKKQVVLWAGEHTHTTRYSTVDGAMESGHRVALEVMELMEESS